MTPIKYILAFLVLFIPNTFSRSLSDPLQSDWSPTDSLPKKESLEGQKDSIFQDSLIQDGPFSFKAKSIDLHTALALFANSSGLSLKTDTLLNKVVNVEFKNKSLNQAMKIFIGDLKLNWKIENENLIIGSPKSNKSAFSNVKHLEVDGDDTYRLFTINYPRVNRKTSTELEGSVNGIGGKAAQVSVSSKEEIKFWEEIETSVKAMVGKDAQLSISQQSGIIFLKDDLISLNLAQKYLEKVVPILTRQVQITARIYEVSLNEDNALGIDWQKINLSAGFIGEDYNLSTTAQTSQSGAAIKASTLGMNLGSNIGHFRAVLSALKEQGDVRSVSQPKIITMNNQTAIVKVGTLYPYFTSSITIDPESGARDVIESAELISIGTWISLTPYISKDSTITLMVDPVVTDLTGSVTSNQGSTAPIVDIKQSSSIVLLDDKETARISGLQQTKHAELQRKIPWLGDIPYLGALFRWSYETKTRKELVIFLTPEIL